MGSRDQGGESRADLAPRLRFTILGLQRLGQRALAEALRPVGLTPAQAEILGVLAERAPITLRDLGGLLVCEANSPSRVVDLLVRRGLVTRIPHPEDRRAVLLTLTPDGWDLLPEIHAADRAIEARFDALLDPAEQDTLLHFLDRLADDPRLQATLRARFPRHAEGPRSPDL